MAEYGSCGGCGKSTTVAYSPTIGFRCGECLLHLVDDHDVAIYWADDDPGERECANCGNLAEYCESCSGGSCANCGEGDTSLFCTFDCIEAYYGEERTSSCVYCGEGAVYCGVRCAVRDGGELYCAGCDEYVSELECADCRDESYDLAAAAEHIKILGDTVARSMEIGGITFTFDDD